MVQKFDGWKPEPKPDWWRSRGPRRSGIPSSSSSFRQDGGRRAKTRAKEPHRPPKPHEAVRVPMSSDEQADGRSMPAPTASGRSLVSLSRCRRRPSAKARPLFACLARPTSAAVRILRCAARALGAGTWAVASIARLRGVDHNAVGHRSGGEAALPVLVQPTQDGVALGRCRAADARRFVRV